MRSIIRILFAWGWLSTPVAAATLWCGGNRNGPFPCPVKNPDNGHYYGFVYERIDGRVISWLEARDQAETIFYRGTPGYLATVTSPSENDFLKQLLPGGGTAKWIGATDSLVEGEWRWATGPEAGQLFWQGAENGTAVMFADWHSGEPSNSRFGEEGEDYAAFGHSVFRNGWNDLPNDGIDASWVNGYVIEFPVPEPSSYALALFGVAALIGIARIRQFRIGH